MAAIPFATVGNEREQAVNLRGGGSALLSSRALAAMFAGAVLVLAPPALAANYSVSNASQLQNAINNAAAGDTITFTSNITLSSNLPQVTKSITIKGGNFTLSGADLYRGFYVASGTVAINDLNIVNAKAQGGNGGNTFNAGANAFGPGNIGGGGGGGAGLGGGLFVAAGATVTTSNVSFRAGKAIGGNGGGLAGSATVNPGGGGGGGLFGNGGDAKAGGYGGDGGDGGGGGGGGSQGSFSIGGQPGPGLFGAGGGGAGFNNGDGARGGFGAGGGAAGNGTLGNRRFFSGGSGGFGGGQGGHIFGGGGAGLGGAIFVQQGGTLQLGGSLDISGNRVAGGSGNVTGDAYGSGLFLEGNGSLSFDPSAGQTQTIADTIADKHGVSIFNGSWSIVKDGAGTTILTGANAYSGGITVNAGVLQGSTTSLLGNIADDASVVFNQASDGTYSRVLSGSGSLTKSGAGKLVLTANNTYSGATTVNGGQLVLAGVNTFSRARIEGGVLQFTTDANLGAAGGPIQILGNGAVGTTTGTAAGTTISRNIELLGDGGISVALNPITWSGAISGGGQFIKSGPGELELTGPNTYTGGTQISDGTLRIASDSELGAAGTGVTLQPGSVLRASETFATSRPFSLLRTSTFLVDATKVLTLNGRVSGDILVKAGAGVLALTGGNNAYSRTVVNGGVLIGNSASINGIIALDPNKDNPIARSVDFSQGHDGTYLRNITGWGSLVKTGVGTLTLKGNNSYTQGTTVLAGTLQGTSKSLQGDIVNDAAVVFDQNFDGTYAGTLTGPGTLEKSGVGRLTLTGNDAVGGGTSIQGGTLAVGSTLTSNVTVYGNGTLAGRGNVIGNITLEGGKIDPGALGSALGIMDTQGAYSQTGGTMVFDIDPNGSSGFRESALQFTPADSVAITGAKIDFDFMDGANPLAFFKSGAFNLDSFFKESDGSLFSDDLSLQSLFASDSFMLNAPGFDISGIGANGAVDLVQTSVVEPSSLAVLITGLAGLLGFAGLRRNAMPIAPAFEAAGWQEKT